MAIYHLSVKIVGRSSGRSAVAAAAYRAAECITNEYDGVTHDFRKKNWVTFKEILLPENAPASFKNRGVLWNAVEAAEKSKAAQLAREFEIALPKELPHERQIELLETFSRQELVCQGMCADICIHNPPVTNDRHQPLDIAGQVTNDISKMQFNNPHAHVLCTMRPIGPDGNWEAKSKAEYVCRRGREEKAMTAEEYAAHKADGWKKLYSYQTENKKKVWLTAEEGNERGLKRFGKQPKTTPYGRKNPVVEYWNAEERILEWRKAWELAVNESLQKIGSEERIDARSYKEQQLDRLPTIHMGVAALNMEKRADRQRNEGVPEQKLIRSDIGDLNRKVRRFNRMMEAVEKEIQVLTKTAETIKEKICSLFLSMKSDIKSNGIRQNLLEQKKIKSDQELTGLSGRIDYYDTETKRIREKINETEKKRQQLCVQLKSFNHILHPKKASDFKKEIEKAEQDQKNLGDYLGRVQTNSGFQNEASFQASKDYTKELNASLQELSENMAALKAEQKNMVAEYKKSYSILPEELKQAVPGFEDKDKQRLRSESKYRQKHCSR